MKHWIFLLPLLFTALPAFAQHPKGYVCNGPTGKYTAVPFYHDADGDGYVDKESGILYYCSAFSIEQPSGTITGGPDEIPKGWKSDGFLLEDTILNNAGQKAPMYDCDDRSTTKGRLLKVWTDKDDDGIAPQGAQSSMLCYDSSLATYSPDGIIPGESGWIVVDPNTSETYDCDDETYGFYSFELFNDSDHDGFGKPQSGKQYCEEKEGYSRKSFDCDDNDGKILYSYIVGYPDRDSCPIFKASLPPAQDPIKILRSELGSSKTIDLLTTLNGSPIPGRVDCVKNCPSWTIAPSGKITWNKIDMSEPSLTNGEPDSFDPEKKRTVPVTLRVQYSIGDGREYYETEIIVSIEYQPTKGLFKFPEDTTFVLSASQVEDSKIDLDINLFDQLDYKEDNLKKVKFSVECLDCKKVTKPYLEDDTPDDLVAHLKWNPVDTEATDESTATYGGYRKKFLKIKAFITEDEPIAEFLANTFILTGTQIISINGITTSFLNASQNLLALNKYLQPNIQDIGFPLHKFKLIYNPADSGLTDFYESAVQKLEELSLTHLVKPEHIQVLGQNILAASNFESSIYAEPQDVSAALIAPGINDALNFIEDPEQEVKDYIQSSLDRLISIKLQQVALTNAVSPSDLLERELATSTKPLMESGKKLLLISHSQGNWYSNEFYSEIQKVVLAEVKNPFSPMPKFIDQVQIAPGTTRNADPFDRYVLNNFDFINSLSFRTSNASVPDRCDRLFEIENTNHPITSLLSQISRILLHHGLRECYLNDNDMASGSFDASHPPARDQVIQRVTEAVTNFAQ
ncbi:MAG: hypothetical protein H7318_17865 [Oligoflexus sp.]|nr:hypothetical protein [Oligoflexus sp.]